MKNFARCLAILLISFASLAFAQSHLMISQIFGGGGNTGAIYNADYVELYNPTSSAISLSGYTVQYASAISANPTWAKAVLPSTLIAPQGYFLVQMSAIGASGAALSPDATASPAISMSSTAGKVALSSSVTTLTGVCPTGGSIVDFVGFDTATCYETAPTVLLH